MSSLRSCVTTTAGRSCASSTATPTQRWRASVSARPSATSRPRPRCPPGPKRDLKLHKTAPRPLRMPRVLADVFAMNPKKLLRTAGEHIAAAIGTLVVAAVIIVVVGSQIYTMVDSVIHPPPCKDVHWTAGPSVNPDDNVL